MHPAKLRELQERIARDITLIPEITTSDIRYIAGFATAFYNNKIVGAVTVFEYPSLKLVEKQTITKPQEMNYIPTFTSFREGPILMELFYGLEYAPDVIIVSGHGIDHPVKCGLATYMGVEAHLPAIAIGIKPAEGSTLDGENVVIEGEQVAVRVNTREHANPLFISPGNLIDFALAKEIIAALIVPPHKLPEPLHVAKRLAKKTRDGERSAD